MSFLIHNDACSTPLEFLLWKDSRRLGAGCPRTQPCGLGVVIFTRPSDLLGGDRGWGLSQSPATSDSIKCSCGMEPPETLNKGFGGLSG